MSNAIFYCDGCNKIILPSQARAGSAVATTAKSLCPGCLSTLSPAERAELMSAAVVRNGDGMPGAHAQAAAESEGLPAHRAPGSESGHAAAPRSFSTQTKLVASACALAGALAGTAVVLVFARRDSGKTGPAYGRGAEGVNSQPTEPAQLRPAGAGPAAPAAAKQLAEIKSMRKPGLKEYSDMRRMLEDFPTRFAGAPEAEVAVKLLAEIDAEHGKLADDALATAIVAANAKAARGDFDAAASTIERAKAVFADGPWLREKGGAATAAALEELAKKRSEWQLRSIASSLEKARAELEAGRLEAAGKLIQDRERWPAEARVKAAALAVAIERKLAVAAAAKRLEEEREAVLAEFDRLMLDGKYADASACVESKIVPGDPSAASLLAAGRVARALAQARSARVRGAKTLVGREVRLKLAKNSMVATVKAATDAGLTVATAFTINGQTRERALDLRWEALHAEQTAELARLGGLEISQPDAAVVAAYQSLASGDLTAAGKGVEAASGHPLGARLARLVRERRTQLEYESAMELAEELAQRKRWEAAARECERALELKPDGRGASRLLAEVRRHLGPASTLTLELDGGVPVEFVYVRPGRFSMGSDGDRKWRWQGVEKPKHEVAITKGFYLGRYEITQAQYEAAMGSNPSRWKAPDRPVEQVSWSDAAEFCRRAGEKTRHEVRLPTEAEWEYACRAGSSADWSHGGDPEALDDYAWLDMNSGGETHRVGGKRPNAWGLYDMHGNVWEWVADLYDSGYYAASAGEDPTGPTSGSYRMVRGGGWNFGAYLCRAAFRCPIPPERSNATMGLRAAVSVTER